MEQAWLSDVIRFLTISVTIVLGVMLITLFFDVRNGIKRRAAGTRLIRTESLLASDERATIRLKDGKTFSGLRLVGVLDQDAARGAGLPHALSNLVAFDRDDGGRVWVDAAAIRVIETQARPGTSV